MYLIADGRRSPFHIVTGQNAHEAVRFAASELQKYIYESTGACVPFFSDRCPRRSPEIMVGIDARDAKERISMEGVGPEGSRIKTDNEDLIIAGTTPRGTLYGVYTFLENFVGFRCFTSDAEKVDRMPRLELPEIDMVENPAFEYREVYFRDAFDGGFAAKNKLNSNMADLSNMRGGKMKFYNFHHSFHDLISADEYFDSHPEYFSLVNGKRRKEGTQLCLTNPDVFELSLAKVREWIEENPDCTVFSVAQNDYSTPCECENCRAVDEREGSHSGTIINFVNKIAENIEKDYPHVLLHTFAYRYSKVAPRNIKPHKNVIVRLCNIECSWEKPLAELAAQSPEGEAAGFLKNLKEWARICQHLYIWDYAVNFSNYLQPFPNLYSMAENLKLYKAYNVKGVLQQGNFSHGGKGALDELKSYVMARLLWNPERDVNREIDDFLAGYYGKSSDCMKAYITLLHESVGDIPLKIYDSPASEIFSEPVLEKADRLLEAAIEAAEDEAVKRRIEKERLAITYVHLARMEMDHPQRNELIDAFAEQVKSFRITEIMERTNLDLSFEIMKRSRYCLDRTGRYSLYYIMR